MAEFTESASLRLYNWLVAQGLSVSFDEFRAELRVYNRKRDQAFGRLQGRGIL